LQNPVIVPRSKALLVDEESNPKVDNSADSEFAIDPELEILWQSVLLA
jgi:hypothetical protein